MDKDTFFIKKCLRLAKRAQGKTSPNPMVGAVIVKDGIILGEGYHKAAGTVHAEIAAIKHSKTDIKGTTLYCNLEPCCHTDKKTPPCVDEIIKSGIKRVVVSTIDPNPAVSDRGLARLKENGIDVTCGILEKDAARLNEVFSKYVTQAMPFTILKIAASLDGKIALQSGQSRWITGKVARRYVHTLRTMVDAVLVGTNTAIKDDPDLTPRDVKVSRYPIRITLDPSLAIPAGSRVFDTKKARSLVFCTNPPGDKVTRLKDKGVEVIGIPEGETKDGYFDIYRIKQRLGSMGITSILVEGGAQTFTSFIKAEAADKLVYIIAPKIIGAEGLSSIDRMGLSDLAKAVTLKDVTTKRLGVDTAIEGYPVYEQ